MRGKLTRYRFDAEQAAPLLAEIGAVTGGEGPAEVIGWRDNKGYVRRVQAVYPNGWRTDVWFTMPKAGKVFVSSIRSTLSLKVCGKDRAA